MGYTGSANLLVRYLNQGRAQDPLPDPSIRRLTGWIMTRPDRLPEQHRAHRDQLPAACPQMTALAGHVETFAHLITQPGGDLPEWIDAVRADDLPALHSFIHGLDKDRPAVSRPDPALQQRRDRRRQHQDQTSEAPDLRPRRLRPAPPTHPAQLTMPHPPKRSPTTKIV